MRVGRVGSWVRGGALFVALAALVVGCASGAEPLPEPEGSSSAVSESPSGSSSLPSTVHVSFYPITSGPPKDAGEAIDYALRVAEAYHKARSAFRADPSRKDDALLVYASGPQAESDISISEQAQQAGVTRSGEYRFEPDAASAVATELVERVDGVESSVPYGRVDLPGCEDVTDLSGVDTEGDEYVVQGLERYFVVLTIMYSPSERRWYLYDLNLAGEDGQQREEQIPC